MHSPAAAVALRLKCLYLNAMFKIINCLRPRVDCREAGRMRYSPGHKHDTRGRFLESAGLSRQSAWGKKFRGPNASTEPDE
jgi:hypothetical protein